MKRRHLLLAGAAAPLGPGVAAQPAAAVDWPTITLIDGSSISPESWRTQPAVVVFWATWCAFCKRHNAHVEALYRASRGAAPLRVLGLALDRDVQAVQQSMARNGYSFPVALDDGSLRARLTSRRMIPMTCLLDRQGHLLQAIPGEMAADDVLGLARQLQRHTG
jgi:thiol-disulfide isomerase/thioredoxin